MTEKPRFRLKTNRRNVPNQELLSDVAESAARLDRDTITMAEYEAEGSFHPSTLVRRFGSWPEVLKQARLKPSRSPIGISEEDLFSNLSDVWTKLGRQPKYDEVVSPLSEYSNGTYENRFGTWNKALEAFVEWANDGCQLPEEEKRYRKSEGAVKRKRVRRKTSHKVSDRLRFRVLMRDGFFCQSCGASPQKTRGVELHVDHVVPWSKGGETVLENLVTKCLSCNLGKGNAFDV